MMVMAMITTTTSTRLLLLLCRILLLRGTLLLLLSGFALVPVADTTAAAFIITTTRTTSTFPITAYSFSYGRDYYDDDDYSRGATSLTRQPCQWRRRRRRPTLMTMTMTMQPEAEEEKAKPASKSTTISSANQIIVVRRDQKWLEQFENLKAFKAIHGHCNVKQRHEGSLGTWVNNQRIAFREDKLRPDRIQLLNDIGFVWYVHQATWHQNYETLVNYKTEHGNCNVPQNQKQPRNRSSHNNNNNGDGDGSNVGNNFGMWVHNQRTAYKEHRLSKERIRLLEEIGFDWDPSGVMINDDDDDINYDYFQQK